MIESVDSRSARRMIVYVNCIDPFKTLHKSDLKVPVCEFYKIRLFGDSKAYIFRSF